MKLLNLKQFLAGFTGAFFFVLVVVYSVRIGSQPRVALPTLSRAPSEFKAQPAASQGRFLRLYGVVDDSYQAESIVCLTTNRLIAEQYVETYRLNHNYRVIELNMLTD